MKQTKHMNSGSFTLPEDWIAIVLALGLAACGGGSSPPQQQTASQTAQQATRQAVPQRMAPAHAENLQQVFENGPPGPVFPKSLEGLAAAAPAAGRNVARAQAPLDGGYAINPESREAVRLFYKTVFLSTGNIASGWNGNIAGCNAGDTSADYKAATLRSINWFRAMAGVPASIQFDTGFNAKAQQAALLMSANGQLSHTPPSSWTCYNATAAEAAGKSNLNLGSSGADAIAGGYMHDSGGNNAFVGHRRWILYPQTKLMGSGDAGDGSSGSPRTNALWVFDANTFTTRPQVRDEFVAWPAKGYTPYTQVYPRWSFSYPDADFSAATVAMTENGAAIATRLEPVQNGYGENTLVWLPGSYTEGRTWAKPAADTVYQVTISNVKIGGQARSFTYNATIFDPEQAGSSTPLTLAGSANATTGQAALYSFNSLAGATSYQWRALKLAPFSLNDGAEAGTGNFTVVTSPGYAVTTSDAAASGASSFHLAHTQAADQTLQLKGTYVAGANSVLSFKSRLGLSTAAQIARVEVSRDDGKSWTSVFQQAGQQSGSTSNFGETAFSVKQVSLAAFADQSIVLRFRYERPAGSFYPQSSAGIGWYIDDIHLDGIDSVATTGSATDASGNSFNFTPDQSGSQLLQVRAGMFGYYAQWEANKRITVSAPQVPVNQTFTSTAANDTFNGAAGLDTVIFSGNRADYGVSKTLDGWRVSSLADGVDSLANIERLKFADSNLALDISGTGGQAYRIYQAAFNRTPDLAGLGFWISRMDAGASLRSVAEGFVNSAEFKTLYGSNPTNADIISRFYGNVLHRAPDSGGYNFWLDILNSKRDTVAGVLASFSESPENQAAVLGVIGNGLVYTPFAAAKN